MVARGIFLVMCGVVIGAALMLVSIVESREARADHNPRHAAIQEQKAADARLDLQDESVVVKTDDDGTTIETSGTKPVTVDGESLSPEEISALPDEERGRIENLPPAPAGKGWAEDKTVVSSDFWSKGSSPSAPTSSPKQLPKTGGPAIAVFSLLAGLALVGIGVAIFPPRRS